MPARDHLECYLEGWRLGDGAHSWHALRPDFYYDDPNTGRITGKGFVQFVEDFKATAAALNGGVLPTPFLTYSNIVIDEQSSPGTAWSWWQVTGTELQGAALIRFDDAGILSERIAYFTELPA